MIPLFLVSLVVGLVVGVLAGLLGIGGGMVGLCDLTGGAR